LEEIPLKETTLILNQRKMLTRSTTSLIMAISNTIGTRETMIMELFRYSKAKE
jgi:hypothetical protein